jgi:IS30 family transposase
MTILKSYGVQIEVEKGLAKGYSPEIIANKLRIEHPHLPTISYEAIYQWIYRDRQDLMYYLLRCNKEDRKKYKRGKRGNGSRKIVIQHRTRFEDLTDEQIREVENYLNNRPKKGQFLNTNGYF